MLNVIILAAGKGTRMGGDKPKVLNPLAGRPLLFWVLETAQKLNPSKIIVIESADRPLSGRHPDVRGVEFVIQKEQKGTADAVLSARNWLLDGGVLTLFGDTPLVDHRDLAKLITETDRSDAYGGLLTARLDDPRQFGRVIKDKYGNISDIVQFKDADYKERKVKDVDAGPLYFKDLKFLDYLENVPASSVSGEAYLNKVIAPMIKDGYKFIANRVKAHPALLGINTHSELEEAQSMLDSELK